MVYNSSEIMKKFGEKVRYYRNLSGLTQEQLSEKCGCSAQTISGTETGYSFPSSKVLFKLSEVLNVPLAYLFNFDDAGAVYNNEVSFTACKLLEKMNLDKKQMLLKMMQAITD